MMFPKGFHYKKSKDLFEWWGIGVCFPYISVDQSYDLGTSSNNYGFYASTGVIFQNGEFYHKFEICVLGFGFWYARQWGY